MSSVMDKYIGWFGSLLLHGLIAILLFYHQFKPHIPETQYIEISLGSIGGGSGGGDGLPKFSLSQESAQPAEGSAIAGGEDHSIALPASRNATFENEIIHLPVSKKGISSELPPTINSSARISSLENEDRMRRDINVVASASDVKEHVSGKFSGSGTGSSSSGTGGSGSGSGFGFGDGIGDGVGFAIQWESGGNRKLLYGEPPSYPAGVNVQAQIKLQLVVFANGSVKFVQPVQKGDTRLENAALRKVRLWKFEPLQSAPPVEQTAIITFNFKLK